MLFTENNLIRKLYFQSKFSGKRFWEHFWQTFPQKRRKTSHEIFENKIGEKLSGPKSLEIFLSKIVLGRNRTFPM